jgi:hypothetical protein
LIGVARAPPIKLNRADPLRASLRSVGWHGKLQKKRNFRPQPTAAHLAARYVRKKLMKKATIIMLAMALFPSIVNANDLPKNFNNLDSPPKLSISHNQRQGVGPRQVIDIANKMV